MKPRRIIVDTGRLQANRTRPVLERAPVFYLGKGPTAQPMYADAVPLVCPHCARAVGGLRAEHGIVIVYEPAP